MLDTLGTTASVKAPLNTCLDPLQHLYKKKKKIFYYVRIHKRKRQRLSLLRTLPTGSHTCPIYTNGYDSSS